MPHTNSVDGSKLVSSCDALKKLRAPKPVAFSAAIDSFTAGWCKSAVSRTPWRMGAKYSALADKCAFVQQSMFVYIGVWCHTGHFVPTAAAQLNLREYPAAWRLPGSCGY